MQSRLREIPFRSHFINLKNTDIFSNLPFIVGGVTQQGTTHKSDNMNNQDAISLHIENDLIIGIVCDGCASTHDNIKATFSNNEIGAKLLAYLMSKNMKELIPIIGISNGDLFIEKLNKNISQQLISIIDILAPNNENEREMNIFDFFMTTVLGFVLTPQNFVIFCSGDGVVGFNNRIKVLDEEGSYFSASLLGECCPSKYTKQPELNNFKVFSSGQSSELQSIFLATDGFRKIAKKTDYLLIDLMKKQKSNDWGGYDNLLQEFRKEIITNPIFAKNSEFASWPEDDASFILLRRIKTLDPELINDNYKNMAYGGV